MNEDKEFENLYMPDGDLNYPLIIKQQLFAGGKMTVWSWGSHNYVLNQEERSLMFDVDGNNFTGAVKITLCWDDLYMIQFIYPDGTVKDVIKGVYCDILTAVIDEYVEKIPQYKR